MPERIITVQAGYDFEILRTFLDENEEDTIGYIDFYQQYYDGKYNIKDIRTWLIADKVDSHNPVHIKETLKWLIGLFVNEEVWRAKYFVAEDSPDYYACRAFSKVMGGKKSGKKVYENKHNWIEFIITLSGFKGKKYEGSLDDLVKIIAHETNLLKKNIKN